MRFEIKRGDMDAIRTIRWKQLHGQLGEITYQLTKLHLTHMAAKSAWTPSLNAYRCRDRIIICVELAGVEAAQIDLRVDGPRLWIRGVRQPPEPDCDKEQTVQILAMEIDHGTFERELALPSNVDANRITAEQRNGFLWIYLPLSSHA